MQGKNKLPKKPYNGFTTFQPNDILVPAIRILPMSTEVFESEKDAVEFLTETMSNRGNTYYYKKHDLIADPNTMILFQFSGTIIAYGIYESENTIDDSDDQSKYGYIGYYKFLNNSIKTLTFPIDSNTVFECFSKNLSQTTSTIALSYFPVLMELLWDSTDDIIEEKDSNIEDKQIKEITDFCIAGIHHSDKSAFKNTSKDYIRAHKNQMTVGKLGEEWVYKYERKRLFHLGHSEHVEKVTIVSEDATLGYDILSFDNNGNELHIEVKSKAGSLNYLDFYISDNEYQKLKENSNHIIYYISHLRSKSPLLFKITGNMLNKAYIKPVLYKISLDYETE